MEIIQAIKNNPGELDKYILTENLSTDNVEKLLGYFLWHKNNICISKLNNYIREFSIRISKNNILEFMYIEECMCSQDKVKNTTRISFASFNQIKEKYPFPEMNDYIFSFSK